MKYKLHVFEKRIREKINLIVKYNNTAYRFGQFCYLLFKIEDETGVRNRESVKLFKKRIACNLIIFQSMNFIDNCISHLLM